MSYNEAYAAYRAWQQAEVLAYGTPAFPSIQSRTTQAWNQVLVANQSTPSMTEDPAADYGRTEARLIAERIS